MLLIIIGSLIGYKRGFNGIGWIIMIVIGLCFITRDILNFDTTKYCFAIIFIILGLFLMLKPKSSRIHNHKWKEKWRAKMKQKYADLGDLDQPEGTEPGKSSEIDKNDIIDSVNVFGGSHQNIYSKKFKGGEVIAVFGGADLNLTQADFEGTIRLDIVAIFGGVKIVIPPGWEVKSEVTAIFGGIDDKRSVGAAGSDPRKILIIEGVALFGGVDIRNF